MNRKFYPTNSYPKNPKGYCTCLYNAFQKYGFHNFTWEVLHTNVPTDRLDYMEDKEITERKTLAPGGYNLKLNSSSSGCAYSQPTINKMVKSQRDVWRKKLHKYRRNNAELEGLPMYVTFYHKKGNPCYRITNHPKCKSRSFYSNKLTVEQLKQQVKDYLADLEHKPKQETLKEKRTRLGIVRGVNQCTKLTKNYYAEFQVKGVKYYKYFGNSDDSNTNKNNANDWVTSKRKALQHNK